MGIVRFALKFPHTFFVLAALILVLGVSAIVSMPTDIFPEINIPVVTVIWQETGLSTPEMEQRVTTYSQYSISTSVNGIRDIEAQTLNGISIQKLYFQPDVDIDLAIAQGEELGVPMLVCQAARLVFKHAMFKGAAKEDITAIVKYLEHDAGFEMPRTR